MNDIFNENASPDENQRFRFKSAWMAGTPLAIEEVMPSDDDPNYLERMEELVHIELEYSWKSSREAPEIEGYLERFPRLSRPEIVQRLIEHECRVRCSNGWRVSLDDFRERFPDHFTDVALEHRLEEIIGQDYFETGDFSEGDTSKPRVRSKESRLGPFGNYELLEELGQGGMGIVYRARQMRPERIVALKVVRQDRFASMPRESQSSTLDRFRQESQAAAQLEHDNIATIYEVGQVEGEPFYSMQFVEGSDLSDLLRDGPLPADRAAGYIEPIARAVQVAHDHGLLHRDLKPQNILIDGENDRPLVVDFGLAKFAETNTELTIHGDVLGSPSYMSPEQVMDASGVTVQSDVYSLGATLYHAITGRPPFQAATPLETVRQVIDSHPAPPHVLNRAVDRDLETICLKCLESEPSRRYLSAMAMADDLSRYLEGKPILARPLGPLGRMWRWCRRNPVVASLISATSLAVMIALVASIIGYVQTSAALSETRVAQQKSEQSHQHARDAVNRFFTLVSEDKLLNQPGMQPLQKELLDEALVYYQQFLEERGDDPTIRDELAMTHFRVGWITEQVESPAKALPWYTKASTMQQQQVDALETDERLRDLATTRNALGRVYQLLGQFEKAGNEYGAALHARRLLHEAHPDNIEYARTLANTWMNLGVMEQNLKRLEKAKDNFNRAMKLRDEILEKHPDHIATLTDSAKGHYNVGALNYIQQKYDDAIEPFTRAHDQFRRLYELDPKDLSNQSRLILCSRLLGDVHTLLNELSEAEQRFDEARKYAETLANKNPDVPEYQATLAGIYMNLGERAWRMSENAELPQELIDEARQWWQQARKILDPLVEQYPEVEVYRRDRDKTVGRLKATESE